MDSGNRRRGRPKGFGGAKPAATIQALDRALDVLDVLAGGDGLTLSELAGRLEQSVATMHRVLATLERRGLVEISADKQEWHVGAEAYRLGSAFLRRHNVVERSRSMMWTLMQETGETSNLGVEKDGNVLFVSQVETPRDDPRLLPAGLPVAAARVGHREGSAEHLRAGPDRAPVPGKDLRAVHRQDHRLTGPAARRRRGDPPPGLRDRRRGAEHRDALRRRPDPQRPRRGYRGDLGVGADAPAVRREAARDRRAGAERRRRGLARPRRAPPRR